MRDETPEAICESDDLQALRRQIAQLQQQIEQLHTEQEYLRSCLVRSTDWHYRVLPDGTIQAVSPACERITGYQPDEFLANPQLLEQIIHPADRAWVLDHMRRECQAQNASEIEFRIIARDGSERWLSHTCQPLYSGQGELLWQQVSNRDITARRETEAAYRVLVENAVHGLVIMQDERFVFVNAAATQLIGYNAAEMLAMSPEETAALIHPDDRAAIVQNRRARQQGLAVPPRYRARILRPQGGSRWLELFASQIMYNGRPALEVTFNDISEQVQAEDALRRSETNLHALIDNTDGLIWAINPRYELIAANQHYLDYIRQRLGVQPTIGENMLFPHISSVILDEWQNYYDHALRGKQSLVKMPSRYIASEILAEWQGYYDRALRGEQFLIELPARFRTPPGYMEYHFSPIYASNGGIAGATIFGRDITSRVETEAALRASQSNLRTLIDNIPNGTVFLFDHDLRFLVAGGQQLASIGLTPQMLEGKTLREAVPAEIADIGEPLYRATLAGTAPTEVEQRYGSRTYRTQPVPVRDEQGSIVAGMIISQEITEHKQTERQLQSANASLRRSNDELRQRNRLNALLKHLSELLQGCVTREDVYEVVANLGARLFQHQSGSLHLWHAATQHYEAVAVWGTPPPTLPFIASDCRALVQRQPIYATRRNGSMCAHFSEPVTKYQTTLCMPLLIRDELLGVLHTRSEHEPDQQEQQRWQMLAMVVARQIATALHNLDLREQLQQQAIRDPLTGLGNRRYLDEMLRHELQRAARQQEPVGIIMFDIDHFKQFNDTHGHAAGDILLQQLGNLVRRDTRSTDIACRYGGEEFVLLLPGTEITATAAYAEQMRGKVAALAVQHGNQILSRITISLGVACFPHHGSTPDDLLRQADAALYRAKQGGRDQVMVAGVQQPE